MTFRVHQRRAWALTGLLAVGAGAWPAEVRAGDHHKQQLFVPTYAAPMAAPAPLMYAAPAPAMTYAAPTATYAAPAPTYAAPAMTYSAPAPMMMYAAPAAAQAPAAANAPGVGNAPAGDGYRLKAVDRNDIIGELRTAAKENASGTSTRERRKALRETAQTKYAEAIGVEATELLPSENNDIDQVVNQIIDSGNVAQAPGAYHAPGGGWNAYGYGYGGAGYAPMYAPQPYSAGYAPTVLTAQPAVIVQPVTPVQLFVPVQPKHRLFHK